MSTGGVGADHPSLDVVVVGSACVDLITCVPRLAGPGETAFGGELLVAPGGKGFNQAMAIRRAGGQSALVAKVGDDDWGHAVRAALVDMDVDTSAFWLVQGVRTAATIVQVPPDGDSAVTVTAGNATRHTPADATAAGKLLAAAAVTIVQLELDTAVVDQVLRRAGGTTIGTLSPFRPFTRKTWQMLDLVVVNAAEAGRILESDVAAEPTATLNAAQSLVRLGPRAAVVTAGPVGATFASVGSEGFIPAPAVEVVDTLGAGDALLGSLALALARKRPLGAATAAGVAAGSAAVARLGAGAPAQTDAGPASALTAGTEHRRQRPARQEP